MMTSPVVTISRTIRALQRARWAADERGDCVERDRVDLKLDGAENAEKAMAAETAYCARAKLWLAAYWVGTGDTEDRSEHVRRMVHIAGEIGRRGRDLSLAVELRACIAECRAVADDRYDCIESEAIPRLEAALAWLTKPRLVPDRDRGAVGAAKAA
jgi:hypothetical protein